MPYRIHECWPCRIRWVAVVQYGTTTNLSGELSQHCPRCSKRSSCATQYHPTHEEWQHNVAAPRPCKPEDMHYTGKCENCGWVDTWRTMRGEV